MTSHVLTVKLDEIRNMRPYELARVAECADPDNSDSAGAELLTGVRDAVIEAVEYGRLDSEHAGDIASEIGREVPSVYTHPMWSAFVDLAAYREDLSEWGKVDGTDLTKSVAEVTLRMIADRLAVALLAEFTDLDDADDDDEDDN